MSDGRILLWFSCGAASTVAAKLAMQNPAYANREKVLAQIVIPTEHADNIRYAREVSEWLGFPITELRSPDYIDPWDVYKKERFLVGPHGARCTTELKKKVRRNFQREGDTHVFGYCYTPREIKRFERTKGENPELDMVAPLIEQKFDKEACLRVVIAAGIKLPAMYEMGYQNNNCIGCPKGGMGYWNKIRVDFPEVFERMKAVEAEIQHTVLRKDEKPLYLKDLDPKAGRYEPLDSGCDLLCGQ